MMALGGLSLLLCAVAFVTVMPWGNWVIRQLLQHGIGKRIRFDGPASHQVKSGTATMGGLYILAGIGIFAAGLALAGFTEVLLPLVSMFVYGSLGAFDDLRGLQDSKGVGWLARYKFPSQWVIAFILALLMFWGVPDLFFLLPWSEHSLEMGVWAVPLGAFLLVATSNAVNLSDGLDGLAGGLSAIAFAAYGVLTAVSGMQALALFCFSLVGVHLAFLWFNVHPASIFMGDTGSQALGAGLAVVAVLSGYALLLPIIGIVFVAEALSVILQVAYFKYTRRKYGEGRRVFRMAPLHHHYELAGLSEVQIVSRFWIVAAVAASLAVSWVVTG